ncbi:hypothetical protein EN829_036555 [Mesorhizobium sp. M00.F.Ca.ET.186.01.1.1]|nr:hypothetical protein EN829_036555 [Mesorhizobium sp. M00.F.Ca.ET.186.01.1.1]
MFSIGAPGLLIIVCNIVFIYIVYKVVARFYNKKTPIKGLNNYNEMGELFRCLVTSWEYGYIPDLRGQAEVRSVEESE